MTSRQKLHRLSQQVLAPGATVHIAGRISELAAHAKVTGPLLDVGCGYRSPLQEIGFVPYGIDIDAARARAFGQRGLVANAAALPFADGAMAAILSFGLLHHLDDADARCAIRETIRVVQPGGMIAIFDGVRPNTRWRRPLAALIRAVDRGHHMRSEASLVGLFDGAPGWHYERVTYAVTGLEGVWCIRSAWLGDS